MSCSIRRTTYLDLNGKCQHDGKPTENEILNGVGERIKTTYN
ncbi:MAG: hypothetical protein QXK37_02270 [Candidatus Woesearchaeota archaeon]